MADVSDPANPLITTAASATVVTDNTQELLMRLRDGVRDETVADSRDNPTSQRSPQPICR